MTPLNGLVLIQQEDAVKETKTESGLVLLSTDNNRYQIGDQETMLQDLIKKPKTNKGEIIAASSITKFSCEGDIAIYKKGHEVSLIEYNGDECVFIKEEDILVLCTKKGLVPNPDYILVKISQEARQALFNKKIKRHDGEEVLLFLGGDKGKEDADSNSIFVGSGEVVSVGENIKNIKKGSLALISYLCDNDDSIIVGYDGGDKIIAIKAITTRHPKKEMSYASRRPVMDNKGKPVYKEGKIQLYSRDRIIYDKDDYDELSSLYGVVDEGNLIAIDPYCFLEQKETKVMKVGDGGIIFEEDEKIISRKVLALSENSIERVGASIGDSVLVEDFDVFNIEFLGKKISCVNDIDILSVV